MDEYVNTIFTVPLVRRVGRRSIQVGGEEDTIEVVLYEVADALGL